jgi:hypothetical protein
MQHNLLSTLLSTRRYCISGMDHRLLVEIALRAWWYLYYRTLVHCFDHVNQAARVRYHGAENNALWEAVKSSNIITTPRADRDRSYIAGG